VLRGQGRVKSLLAGKTVEDAGLNTLYDSKLVALERSDGRFSHAVSQDDVLHEGDVLWFVGFAESVKTLRGTPGAPLASPLGANAVQLVPCGKSDMTPENIWRP
jgi:uncharacterized protein with PhoU and TrkA domain